MVRSKISCLSWKNNWTKDDSLKNHRFNSLSVKCIYIFLTFILNVLFTDKTTQNLNVWVELYLMVRNIPQRVASRVPQVVFEILGSHWIKLSKLRSCPYGVVSTGLNLIGTKSINNKKKFRIVYACSNDLKSILQKLRKIRNLGCNIRVPE